MHKHFSIKYLLFLLVVPMLFASCRENNRDYDTTTVATEDHLKAEFIYADVFRQIHKVTIADSLLNDKIDSTTVFSLDGCIDTTYVESSGSGFPKTLTIDFGDDESACSDGYVRQGKIEVEFSGKYKEANTLLSMKLQGYYFNGLLVKGTANIRNKGTDDSGNRLFGYSLNDGEIKGDSLQVEWSCRRTWEWNSGSSSDQTSDDDFKITGTADGRHTKGNTFEVEITTDLEYVIDCEYIGTGVLELTPANLVTRTVDLGSGSCDGDASVTFNGNVYDIEVSLSE